MNEAAVRFVMSRDLKPAGVKLVALVLAANCGPATASVSIPKSLIADQAAMTVDRVKQCLRQLRDEGLLVRSSIAFDGHGPNTYTLIFAEGV